MAARNQACETSSTLKQTNAIAALEAALDPLAAAKLAKLRHVSDDMPGITRHKARNGFDYRLPDGQLVRDLDTLKRIRSLVIPPAWTAVWICPHSNGHIQAIGRDKRGRKQYRYHPRWREVRDESKYGKMLAFGRVLPAIRERVEADLRQRGLPRERVLAAVVRLMETTLFRVGNVEYAKANKSYGLTTLRDRHVAIDGSHIHLDFRGKHGIRHQTDINDRRLARIIKDCRDLPGYELFQYLDEEGNRHTINSADVNDYLREISGEEITAKDFRTWAATNLAALGPAGIRAVRHRSKEKTGCRPRRRKSGEASGQYAGDLPPMLYSSGHFRRLSRRHPADYSEGPNADLSGRKRGRDERRGGGGGGVPAIASRRVGKATEGIRQLRGEWQEQP